MHRLRLTISFLTALLGGLSVNVSAAQDRPPPSECLAIAQSVPRVMFASLSRVAAERAR